MKLLKQALAWACTVLRPDGEPLLVKNPLNGFEAAAEADVRRPVASQDRFLATRKAIRARQAVYEREATHEKRPKARRRAEQRAQSWVCAALALVLLEATGRRRGSVAALRWDDIDFERCRILWRGEHDKKRKTWDIVYGPALFEELRQFQSRLGVIGGCLFPRLDDDSKPTRPELLSQWLAKAEQDAGLTKLDGSLCHAYRRQWKSERSHLPVTAVGAAGGWQDIDTMLNCYDIPDDEAILAVTSEPRRRWEARPVSHVAGEAMQAAS